MNLSSSKIKVSKTKKEKKKKKPQLLRIIAPKYSYIPKISNAQSDKDSK